MTPAESPTFLRTTDCGITSVHHFFNWEPIIMKAFGMCDPQFYIVHCAKYRVSML